ncbi:MAG: hypothetical protein QNK37_38790 [Acidobacteriota bacterium]|nr:hypothetical protein [Acidobacteriota bacterium]
MENEGVPKYIQVIRLFEPNQVLTFAQAARLACNHFDWYEDGEDSAVKQASAMLRASLKPYPELIVKKGRVKAIDGSLALAFANKHFPKNVPISSLEPSQDPAAVKTPGSEDQNRYISPVIPYTIVAALILVLALSLYQRPGETIVDKIETLKSQGDIEGLLALNQPEVLPVFDPLEVEERARALSEIWGVPVSVPNPEVKDYPYQDQIGKAISEISTEEPIEINPEQLIGVLPYLSTPTWLMSDGVMVRPVKLGTWVAIPNTEQIGFVTDVTYSEIFFTEESGLMGVYQRPMESVLGIFPQHSSATLFLGKGNLALIYEYATGLPYNGRDGSLIGWFKPITNLDELADLTTDIMNQKVPLAIRFHSMSISSNVLPENILRHMVNYLPFEVELKISSHRDRIWFRGESFREIGEYFGLEVIWSTPVIMEVK